MREREHNIRELLNKKPMAARILEILYQRGKLRPIEMKSILNFEPGPALYATLSDLIERGLIVKDRIKGKRMTFYRLTPQGKIIVRRLLPELSLKIMGSEPEKPILDLEPSWEHSMLYRESLWHNDRDKGAKLLNHENIDVILLFSGGRDSTIAALRLAEREKRTFLLTFKHDYIKDWDIAVFYINDRYHEIKKALRESTLEEYIVGWCYSDCGGAFSYICHQSFEKDIRTYGTPIILCVGCKMAMLAEAAVLCKLHNIRYLMDGANSGEGGRFIDKAEFNNIFKNFLKDEFEIIYDNPVYNERCLHTKLEATKALLRYGIYTKAHEAFCSLRYLTTKEFEGIEDDVKAYIESKLKLMHKYINERLKKIKNGEEREFLW
ncbi:MAG: hypothetical protein DRN91_07900 [Candidatus Alkanophagales archaeon]|nr:MAG: hypothetical protein DRN91_07900 [Candidatus Alkanophagales archaeon]